MAEHDQYDRRYRYALNDGVVLCVPQGRYSNRYTVTVIGAEIGVAERRSKVGEGAVRTKRLWYAVREGAETGPFDTLKDAAEELFKLQGSRHVAEEEE
jgi:hypothetical protein